MRPTSIIATGYLLILLATQTSVHAQSRSSSKLSQVSSTAIVAKPQEGTDRFDPSYPLTLLVKIDANRQIQLNGMDAGSIGDTYRLTGIVVEVIHEREQQRVFKPGTDRVEKTVWVVASSAIKEEEVRQVIEKIRVAGAFPIIRLTEKEYNDFLASADPRTDSSVPMRSTAKAPIRGGILNGKAISKPMPPYPPIAKAARASGLVTVQITIDEEGKVISARAVGGHPLLQQAGVQAAYQARFAPTRLSGQPIKVTGVLTYNFVLK